MTLRHVSGVLAGALAAALCGGCAAPTSEGESPITPAAQAALDRGIVAARFGDYPVAVEYFEQAWRAAPDEPIVYLNLGIAESRIPSNQLRAMAWFGAYLAARPDAPNAGAVKAEIGVLEERSRQFIEQVLDELHGVVAFAAPSFVRPDLSTLRPDHSDCLRVLISVAQLFADWNHITTAVGLEAPYRKCRGEHRPYVAADAAAFWQAIALAQARNGDLAGARASAAKIPQSEPAGVQSVRTYINSRESRLDTPAVSGNVSQTALSAWFFHLDLQPDSTARITEDGRLVDCEDAGFAPDSCPVLRGDLTSELDSLTREDDSMEVFDGLGTIARRLVDGHRLVATKLKRQGAL